MFLNFADPLSRACYSKQRTPDLQSLLQNPSTPPTTKDTWHITLAGVLFKARQDMPRARGIFNPLPRYPFPKRCRARSTGASQEPFDPSQQRTPQLLRTFPKGLPVAFRPLQQRTAQLPKTYPRSLPRSLPGALQFHPQRSAELPKTFPRRLTETPGSLPETEMQPGL